MSGHTTLTIHPTSHGPIYPPDLGIAESLSVLERLSSIFPPPFRCAKVPVTMKLEIGKTNHPPAMQYKVKDDTNFQPSIRTKSVFPWTPETNAAVISNTSKLD